MKYKVLLDNLNVYNEHNRIVNYLTKDEIIDVKQITEDRPKIAILDDSGQYVIYENRYGQISLKKQTTTKANSATKRKEK